jgi:peptide/nickel transport system ATP-binding protein
MAPVLHLEGLTTSFFTDAGAIKAVDDVTLTVDRGEVVGLVGESGSGKSVTGFSIMGLVSPPGRVTSGRILFDGSDLLSLPESEWQKLRGRRLAMVFQDPMMTLNPVLRIDTQVIEAIRAHERVSRAAAWNRALEALAKVGIPAPEDRLRSYPHQLSGGMRQRVAIAIALLHGPDVLIADEPTTALDVTIQGQILAEVQTLCRESGTALLWITHDLAVVAGLANRIAVMYAGRIVEKGDVDDVLDAPRHPYTRGLLDSLPEYGRSGGRLRQIPGRAPGLNETPPGCAFAPRCQYADALCATVPPLQTLSLGHAVRCIRPLPEPTR